MLSIDAIPLLPQGHYTMVNRAMCEQLGKSREELLGCTFEEVVGGTQEAELVGVLQRDDHTVLETGQPLSVPDLFLQPTNSQGGRWFRHVKMPYTTVDGQQVSMPWARKRWRAR